MALIAAHLNAEVILVMTVSGRYTISLFPHLHNPFPPFSPSLISRTVSVDVKHHVYLLCSLLRPSTVHRQSPVDLVSKRCFTSTETIRTVREWGAQSSHFSFHTAPEL